MMGSGLPKIGVVGLGAYYSKLAPWLVGKFDQVALIDARAEVQETLAGSMRGRFTWAMDPECIAERLSRANPDGVLLLIPPESFQAIALPIVQRGLRVLLEKPFCRDGLDLERILEELRSPDQILFSDYYRDVRSLPLMSLCQGNTLTSLERSFVKKASAESLEPGGDLTAVTKIIGRLNERAPFINGEWRSEAEGGGVVRDLMVHLLAVIQRLFPDRWLRPREVVLTQPSHARAESRARVIGHLVPGGLQIDLEVQKGAVKSQRHLTLLGPDFSLRQSFDDRHEAYLERKGKRLMLAELAGNHYELSAALWRCWLDNSAISVGPRDCREIVSILDLIRLSGERLVTRRTPASGEVLVRVIDKPHEREQRTVFPVTSVCTIPATADHDENKSPDWLLESESRVLDSLNTRADEMLDSLGPQEARMEVLRRHFFYEDWDRKIVPRTIVPPVASYVEKVGSRGKNYGHLTFPHEAAGMAAFKAIAGNQSDKILVGESYKELADQRTRFVCFGSSVVNELTRMVFPLGLEGKSELRSLFALEKIPYRIVLDRQDPDVKVYSAMLGGERLKRRKAIIESMPGGVYRKHSLPPQEYLWSAGRWQGWLRRDRLLVSKLPINFEGGSLLLIEGGHGSGTEAFRLLLSEKAFDPLALSELNRLLIGWRYFQIVFEVEDIRHEKAGSSPRHLRVSSDLPPRQVHLSKELLPFWNS